MFFTLYTGVLLWTIVLIFSDQIPGAGGREGAPTVSRGRAGTLIINIIVMSDVLSPVAEYKS